MGISTSSADRSTGTLIDLFAGAGGLSRGLEDAGYASVYANEFIPQFAETYRQNHPEAWVDSRDIRNVDPSEVRQMLGLREGELDLLAGGPPCQGFSVNAPSRRADDRRNHLFLNYLAFVEEFQPRAVLIENVPGLVSFSGGTTLDAILESLEELGYQADVQILYAPHFGVPQTRWRTIVLGIRDDLNTDGPIFPAPAYHAPARVNFTSSHRSRPLVRLPEKGELSAHTSVRDAIGDLPVLKNKEKFADGGAYRSDALNAYQHRMRSGSAGVSNHHGMGLSPVNLERLKYISPGGNWTDIPRSLLPAGMQRARTSDHTKRYGRPRADQLSSTILTKCDPHWGAYFHYEQDRIITVREAARIQSFPDTYLFTGSISEQYAQVGNAVPALMAQAIGEAVRSVAGLTEQKSATLAS